MDAWVRSKLAEVVGSDGADSTTAPSRQMPVPTIAIENKPPPEKDSRRLQTYGRTNTGQPPTLDAGATQQKTQPPRGMEFLPKLASTENDHMTTSTMGRPPLQELIKTAMEGAASKIDVSLEAARQIANNGGTPPQSEKTAAAKQEHLPTELIHKLAAAAHYGATQLNPKLADANFPTHTSTGPGEGPNALGVMAATEEGDGVMEAGQSGHATAKNLPPKNPPLQKDPTRNADPGTGLESNDGMEHPEQPVEPIPNEKASLSNENVKASQVAYVNNLIATGLLKTAATPQGIVLVPQNELVKQALVPIPLPMAGGAALGAVQAPEGRALEGAGRGAVGSVTAPVGAALGGAGGAVSGGVRGGISGAGTGARTGALAGGVAGGLGGAAAGGLTGAGLGALGGAALGHLTGLGAGTGALYGAGAGGVGGALAGGAGGALLGSGVGGAAGVPVGAALGAGKGTLVGGARGAVSGGKRGWDLAMGPLAKQGAAKEVPKEAQSTYARNLMAVGLFKQAEDALNPAKIKAGPADAQGAEPPKGAAPSEEGIPPEPGDVTSQKNKMLGSNQAAIDYTKRDAKGDPKKDVDAVLNEPAQTKSTDSVLEQALDHTSQAGAKISSADMTRLAGARAVLQKLAAVHQPPAKKVKKSMVPGMGGGQPPAPSSQLPSTPSQSSGFTAQTQA